MAPPERLVDAIRVAGGGDALLDPLVTRHVIETFIAWAPHLPEPAPELSRLTAREAEILNMLARGMSNTEIAATLSSATPRSRRTLDGC